MSISGLVHVPLSPQIETHPTILVGPKRIGPISQNVGAAFDLEGTTVDLEDLRHSSHLEAAAKLGFNLDRDQAILNLPHFIGGPDENVGFDLHNLSKSTLPRLEYVDRFLALTRESFEAQMEHAIIQPRPGVVDFIDWLRGRNVPFSIGSLTNRDQAFAIIKRSGLDLIFGERVLVREDVVNVKPDPEIYLSTAQIMRIRPGRQIVFEDSPRGVAAAIAAGSSAIGMPVIIQPSTLKALEEARANRIFTDWQDPDLREYVSRLIEVLKEN